MSDLTTGKLAVHNIEGQIIVAEWFVNPRGLAYPFSVMDSFHMTASYTFDPAQFPDDYNPDSPGAANFIDFRYEFSVGGMQLQNDDDPSTIAISQNNLLSTDNFSFNDETPQITIPGFTDLPVDAFTLNVPDPTIATISDVILTLNAGDSTRGKVVGKITSSVVDLQDLPPSPPSPPTDFQVA